MSSAIDRIKELQEVRAIANAAFAKESKELFTQACADLFVAHPLLVSFSWNQYSPYFNDGDECVFSANTDYISLLVKTPEDTTEEMPDADTESEDEDDDDDDDEFGGWGLDEIPEEKLTPKQKAGKEVLALLALFNDDDYRTFFDNHVKVKVTVEGIKATEYDHD